MSRDALLARIRAASPGAATVGGLPSARDARPAPPELPALPAPQAFDDPVGLFIDRARDLGAGVERVASVQEAAEWTAAWVRRRGLRRVAVWETPDLAPVLDGLRAEGIDILGPGSPVETLAQADAGVTGAEWGIAETATLALASGRPQPRLVSLLPPVHLAILRADRIVADLHAFFVRCGALPSSLTLITGPSRSADIGSVLVLGAHGPTEVLILLIGR